MINFHPFPPYEAQSSRYHVTVDGTDAPLHCARVSAYPFNRCWPGHQRPVEQTELAYFVQYETDGPTVVTVQNVKAFAAVAVNPVSAGVTAERTEDSTRGKIHDITFRNIQVFADRMPSSYFIGYDETHRVENITVDGLYFNGRRITSAEEGNLTKTKFADPVSLK